MLEDGLKNVNDEVESENEDIKSAMITDAIKDNVGVHYLKVVNYVSFDDATMYTVELPASEHGVPEVREAKMSEVNNLMDYDVFEKVEDKGQETISSRGIITAKEKHDGQKQKIKARLVARGFQETEKPQSDSPTVSKEYFEILMAIAANNGFKLASVDIRAAFLQSKTLDRDIFMKPLQEATIWIG